MDARYITLLGFLLIEKCVSTWKTDDIEGENLARCELKEFLRKDSFKFE